jgi:hypothetical protein
MRDYATAAGALAFIIGILMIGLSGSSRRARIKALIFSVGAFLVLAGFGVEAAGVVHNMGASDSSSSASGGSSTTPSPAG